MTLEQASARLREIQAESAENERFYGMGIKTYSEYCLRFSELNKEARRLQKEVDEVKSGPPVHTDAPALPKSRYSKLIDTIYDTTHAMLEEGVFTFFYRIAVLALLGYIIDKL